MRRLVVAGAVLATSCGAAGAQTVEISLAGSYWPDERDCKLELYVTNRTDKTVNSVVGTLEVLVDGYRDKILPFSIDYVDSGKTERLDLSVSSAHCSKGSKTTARLRGIPLCRFEGFGWGSCEKYLSYNSSGSFPVSDITHKSRGIPLPPP
jgi:hypothetical protein